ncbi:MAG: hypothetical protein ACQEUI_05520, partial [Actinomycetota bacterium]
MNAGDVDNEEHAPAALVPLVLRVLGIAALIVGASAALFYGLGRIGDDPLVIADGPDGEETTEDGAGSEPDQEPEP